MTLSLEAHLAQWSGGDPQRIAIAQTVQAIAGATLAIADLIARGDADTDLAASRGAENGGVDVQKELDVRADELVLAALRHVPVAAYASEEREDIDVLRAEAPLLVAADPLDGSSNIDTNVSIGTIFSILPAPAKGGRPTARAIQQCGHAQLGAGYAIYGPQTALVLTVGAGTDLYVHDRALGGFRLQRAGLRVLPTTKEFAINMSNYRHWDEPMRHFIDDLLHGHEGPYKTDYNMRWIGSMVAEAHRILMRGGIFLYPGDRRKGYQHGRLRLIYEANPIAFVMEQAGAAASDGVAPILDIEPKALHQRTPLVFGSRDKVARVAGYLTPATRPRTRKAMIETPDVAKGG